MRKGHPEWRYGRSDPQPEHSGPTAGLSNWRAAGNSDRDLLRRRVFRDIPILKVADFS
jgi:hypothetical protein